MKKKEEIQTVVLKTQLARALADYDNLRKRVEREKEDFEKYANVKLAIRLLPVLDVLRQAQKHIGDPGIAITITQFEDALKGEGIEEIEVVAGDDFNPQFQEAVEVVAEGKGKGKVKEVVLTGWRFTGGPVIRHARVKVTKKG